MAEPVSRRLGLLSAPVSLDLMAICASTTSTIALGSRASTEAFAPIWLTDSRVTRHNWSLPEPYCSNSSKDNDNDNDNDNNNDTGLHGKAISS